MGKTALAVSEISASRGKRYRDVTTKRVLVTGASGFVGRPLVTALLRAGYAVRAATRGPVSFPNSVDVVIVPDFKTTFDWRPILRGVDIVIHLAGLAHADSRAAAFGAFDQVNLLTTLNLARAAKDVGLDRFIFISSIRAQIGASATQIVREQDEPHPTDDYGRSKLAAELAVRSTGVPFTILRPVAIYGPHPKGNIKTLVRLANSPLLLPFKGFNNRRSLLGIDNLIATILFVLNNQSTVGEKFLIADPVSFTLPDLFTMLRKAQGRKPGMVYVPPIFIRLALWLSGQSRLWKHISGNLVVDTSKLESLGWRPPVETYEGLRAVQAAENGKG